MKHFKKVLPILLVCVIIFLGGCVDNSQDDNNDAVKTLEFHGKEFPIMVSEDIEITKAFLYDGEFPEDGSFRKVNDVFALQVKNISGKDIQLVRLYIVTDQKDCFFEVTTLPAKKTVTVLEKDAQTLAKDEKILEITEDNKVFFNNGLSLHTDKFQITPLNKVINIKNVSDTDITSDVYVYFKRVDANGDYFGGITFRSNAGALNSGEMKQLPASHFIKENSEVLFVDYGMQ